MTLWTYIKVDNSLADIRPDRVWPDREDAILAAEMDWETVREEMEEEAQRVLPWAVVPGEKEGTIDAAPRSGPWYRVFPVELVLREVA